MLAPLSTTVVCAKTRELQENSLRLAGLSRVTLEALADAALAVAVATAGALGGLGGAAGDLVRLALEVNGVVRAREIPLGLEREQPDRVRPLRWPSHSQRPR